VAERLFTDDELADLARPPEEQIDRLLAAVPAEAVGTWAASVERSWQGSVTGYHDWIAQTEAYLLERHGPAALSRLVPVTAHLAAVHPDREVAEAHGGGGAPSVPEALAADAAAGDLDGARARFGGWHAERRRLHDLYRDLLSAVLSDVYVTYGVDDLESALRYAGERTLLGWLPADVARPPEKRLVSWTRMLHGHFTRFTLEEDESKFTVVQDPCGSCTRQILQGRYGPPVSLAVVSEVDLPTPGRGDTPIYRAHVPVMHQSLPYPRLGVPWPVNLCPAGMGTGPCRILLYKDPLDPAAREWFEWPPPR
jgi:hypothetical protein